MVLEIAIEMCLWMILLETVLLQAPVQPTLYEAQHYTQYILTD